MDQPFDAPATDAQGWRSLLPDGRVQRWVDRRKAVWIARRADTERLLHGLLTAIAAHGWSYGRVGDFSDPGRDCKVAVIASGPHVCAHCFRCPQAGLLLAPLRLFRWRRLVRTLDEAVLDSLVDGSDPAQAVGSPVVACP